VSARSLAKHALSIFNDHSDVMACRQTGVAMLCSSSVQEAHDFSFIAHITTLKARLPFLHFFDGWRTSSEIQQINETSYEDIAQIYPYKAKEENLDNQRFNNSNAMHRGGGQSPLT
jgi:pyruvate/2-oxoacid:ferredoxin oxidoreductase alpha subunit